MKFLISKFFWILIFIIALGTFLRLIFIDKPEGLWNDEYISWYIASIPFGIGFIKAVFAQCHMPFYYLYLKFFMFLFGGSDLVLRLTSVFTGVLSIPAMYFVGKEFKDKKLGILCAQVTAISSFLIYFSQEVRFYGILFLFSALSLLFTLRLARKQNLSNYVSFLVFQILIMFTHTIGFVFVAFNLIFMSIWLIKTDKNYIKPILKGWAAVLIFGLMLLPHLHYIFTVKNFSQWWGSFSYAKIGFLITDYFSPILTNIVNSPNNFFYNLSQNFIIFALLPSIIAIIGLIKALTARTYKVTGLFLVSLAYILVLIYMSVLGKLVFITKYSIEIYPILILLMGFGLLSFNNIVVRRFLIIGFCFLNMYYLFTSPNSAPRMHRAEGHKLVANLIKNANLKKGDYILLNYYSKEKFEKYFNFNDYNVFAIDKGSFSQYLTDLKYPGLAILDGKNLYKKTFGISENKYFNRKIDKEIINKMKPNQKLTIIILDSVAIYSPVQVQMLAKNPEEYKKAPFLFMVFSEIKNQELKECLKKLHLARYEERGSWSAVTFIK